MKCGPTLGVLCLLPAQRDHVLGLPDYVPGLPEYVPVDAEHVPGLLE